MTGLVQDGGKFSDGLSWLCWAYNEEALIEGYLRRAHALLAATVDDFEIVVVDDGSSDGTPGIVERLRETMPQIKLHRHQTNLGTGQAMRTALRHAANDCLFYQTVDWSYDIRYFRDHLELLRDYDIVFGARRWTQNDARVRRFGWGSLAQLLRQQALVGRSDNLRKTLISTANYILLRLLFKVPLSDLQNISYFRKSLIQSLDLEGSSAFLCPEIMIKTHWAGWRIAEVPVPFIPRRVGRGKGTRLREIAAAVRDIFAAWHRWRRAGLFAGTPGRIDYIRRAEWDFADDPEY